MRMSFHHRKTGLEIRTNNGHVLRASTLVVSAAFAASEAADRSIDQVDGQLGQPGRLKVDGGRNGNFFSLFSQCGVSFSFH